MKYWEWRECHTIVQSPGIRSFFIGYGAAEPGFSRACTRTDIRPSFRAGFIRVGQSLVSVSQVSGKPARRRTDVPVRPGAVAENERSKRTVTLVVVSFCMA